MNEEKNTVDKKETIPKDTRMLLYDPEVVSYGVQTC